MTEEAKNALNTLKMPMVRPLSCLGQITTITKNIHLRMTK